MNNDDQRRIQMYDLICLDYIPQSHKGTRVITGSDYFMLMQGRVASALSGRFWAAPPAFHQCRFSL